MPVSSVSTPVSSSVSRIAHWLGVSPSSCLPIGIAHCPVSRRRCSSTRPELSAASTPQAGTRLFGLGAAGSFQYSTRPMSSDLLAEPGLGRVPHPLEAADVVLGELAAVQAAQVQRRVGRGGLTATCRKHFPLSSPCLRIGPRRA